MVEEQDVVLTEAHPEAPSKTYCGVTSLTPPA